MTSAYKLWNRTLTCSIAGISKAIGELDIDQIDGASEKLFETYLRDGTVYVFGNGGSAAIANHLNMQLRNNRMRRTHVPVNSFSLVGDIELVTARANDYGFENVFSYQLEGCGVNASDSVVAISSGGESKNILNAVEYANGVGARTIGIVGGNGGSLKHLADACVLVRGGDYFTIEVGQHAAAVLLYRSFEDRILRSPSRKVTGSKHS